MRRVTAAEVHARKVQELGLDPTALDLTSIEAIAGAIRRAASLYCPCTAATLVRSVLRPLRGLADELQVMKELIQETLESMIAHGDVIEAGDIECDRGQEESVLLYAAPPSFVGRASGSAILLGIASDQPSALPDDLQSVIEYVNHLRRLHVPSGRNIRRELLDLGLIEVSDNAWLRCPAPEPFAQRMARIDDMLDKALPSREIPGLVLLLSDRPVRYYRGRWAEPRLQSGRFVARRRQAYGTDLWCYVQLQKGQPERLIDLPLPRSRWRGCDEAWHLQMAMDAARGHPQQFRVRSIAGDRIVLEFFSPVPMWARRRWDAVGEPVPPSSCLFAYRIARAELDEELRFMQMMMWLEELAPGV